MKNRRKGERVEEVREIGGRESEREGRREGGGGINCVSSFIGSPKCMQRGYVRSTTAYYTYVYIVCVLFCL